MATLAILGCGEAFDPQLPNTSLLYQGGRTVLIDCGFAVAQSLWRYSNDSDFLDAIFITHHHADHTFGVPALLMVMQGSQPPDPRRHRTRPLTIIGPLGTQAYITQLFDLAYTPGLKRLTFPVEFVECSPGETLNFGPLTINTALPNHWIPVLSSRWEEEGVCKFAYSADGQMTAGTRALFSHVPVLVHECFALPGNEGPIHTNVQAVLELATASNTQTLVLVHQAMHQRDPIAAFVQNQKIFTGQVLMPTGVLQLTV